VIEPAAAIPAASADRRPRAVLLVANSARPYSRALRVGRSLAEAGWQVEIAAVAGDGAPAVERDGEVVIRRYRPSGPLTRWVGQPPPPRPPTRLLRVLALNADKAMKVLFWPLHVRAWWRTLRRELPPADLYHAFGILTLPAALDLAAAARGRGRQARVVYDVIDAILDSNNYQNVPTPVLARYRRAEAAWVRRVDAVVTVNEALADHCQRLWPFRERPTVLLNCQPRWTPPPERPDLIRQAAGLPAERRIVLFLGKLGRERGLEMAAEAVARLPDAALVMLGSAVNREWDAALRAKSAEARFAGRHVVLPPVHPDEVPVWAASADVSIIAVPATSLNQRLSTPNKFWESLAAGTPVVIGEDLEVMRGIVDADGLGAVADPTDPADLARALGEILDQPQAAYLALRSRCLAVSRDRYNWETAVLPYLALVARRKLAPGVGPNAPHGTAVIPALPPTRLRAGGAHFRDDDDFLHSAIAEAREVVAAAASIRPLTVLDLGCGAGRLAYGLIAIQAPVARYEGVDVMPAPIEWCARTISPGHDAFRFRSIDVYNERYNPGGSGTVVDGALPFEATSFGVAYAYSVFSHMLTADVLAYLREFDRLLTADGVALVTAFVEDDVPDEVVNPPGYQGMAWGGALHCVRFSRAHFDSLVRVAGLQVVRFEHGQATDGQSRLTLSRIPTRTGVGPTRPDVAR
jgi:glycosyltransferase involved in cell wall biosynthesis/SAM-dependent methyltransferase